MAEQITHSFDTEIAAIVGVTAAVIYKNLKFWIELNEKNGRNIRNGQAWVYYSVSELLKVFPYMKTEKRIRTARARLISAGLVVVGNFNQHANDRTTWFGLPISSDQKGRPSAQKGTPTADSGRPSAQKGTPIPDTNPDSTPDSEPDHKPRARANPIADAALPLRQDLSPLAEPLRLYAEHCFKFDRIACDPLLSAACQRVGVETVANALRRCAQQAQEPGHEKRYTPQLSKLLNDSDNLLKRAALYKPPTAHPETGPPQLETVAWLKAMSDAERRAEFAEAQRLGQTWPEEVLRIWPESLTTQAS